MAPRHKRWDSRSHGLWDTGSAILFALFACMVAALCVHVLTATVMCARNGLADEMKGRGLLAATDACLAGLRSKAAVAWAGTPWEPLESGGALVSGSLIDEGESFGWTLSAQVREIPSALLGVTSATVEHGRDGLELPRAAVVTSCVRSSASRTEAWLLRDDETTETVPVGAKAYVGGVEGASVIGADCVVESLDHEWRLDDGWRALLKLEMPQGSRVYVTEGSPGESLHLSGPRDPSAPDRPVLIVVTGGAALDLRGLGELWGVVVVDEGSLSLEGTVVHGAVYATECVDVGESGQVVFDESVWQWARDASLVRVRLVPGSRQEGTE